MLIRRRRILEYMHIVQRRLLQLSIPETNFTINFDIHWNLEHCSGSQALAADRGDELAVATNSELVGSGSVSEPNCQRDGPSCLDCRTVGYCRAGALTRVSCRGLFPYCDQTTGTCTGDRNRCKIPETKSMIECPAQGYFPDPETCRGFYVCEGTPLKSYKFQCTQLQVYDPEEKKCTRPSLRSRCQGFSCLGKQGRYTAYSGDEAIYAMCRDGQATDPLKCPDGEIFEEARQKCQRKCSSEKNLPDLDDKTCKRYIRCTKSGNRFLSSPGTCLGQRLFNPDTGKCVEPSEYKCLGVQTSATPVNFASSPSSTTSTPGSSTQAVSSTSTTTSRIGLAARPFDSALLRDEPVAPKQKEETPILKPTETNQKVEVVTKPTVETKPALLNQGIQVKVTGKPEEKVEHKINEQVDKTPTKSEKQ